MGVTLPNKVIYAASIVWLSSMLIYSTLVITGEYYTDHTNVINTVGVVQTTNPSVSGAGSDVTVKILATMDNLGNVQQPSKETIAGPYQLNQLKGSAKQNQTVSFAVARDSLNVPVLHPARSWNVILLDGKVASEAPPHTGLMFVVAGWIATLVTPAGVLVVKMFERNHRQTYLAEEMKVRSK